MVIVNFTFSNNVSLVGVRCTKGLSGLSSPKVGVGALLAESLLNIVCKMALSGAYLARNFTT